MSKYVKQLMTEQISDRLEGVADLLLVDVSAVDANKSVELRKHLRERDIQLLVVKNTMARRAAEGTPLAPAFEGVTGSAAVIWGSTDIVSLAKEVVKLDEGDDYEQFKARGGVMDGQPLSPEQVKEVSKWPGREELLSLIAGQAIGVASTLAGQLTAPAQQLASQIEKLIEMKEQESGEGAAEGSAENS